MTSAPAIGFEYRPSRRLQQSLIAVAALAVLLALDGVARRVPRVDRLFAGTALPVLLLLAAGADKTLKNNSGNSPEDLANSIANYDVAQYLRG